jgi:hypothetical protein
MKIIISIAAIVLLCTTSCKEQKTVQATVLSHAVTSDRIGTRTYITIIRTDDGYIEEKTGLSYYVIPVGNKVKVKVWRKEL